MKTEFIEIINREIPNVIIDEQEGIGYVQNENGDILGIFDMCIYEKKFFNKTLVVNFAVNMRKKNHYPALMIYIKERNHECVCLR